MEPVGQSDVLATPPGSADNKASRTQLLAWCSNSMGPNAGVAVQMQMTPPQTPVSPQGGDHAVPIQPLFHNYLRAFHAFDPASGFEQGDSASLVTICIKPGDLILVHSIHANGWADGTVPVSYTHLTLPTKRIV